MSSNINPLNPLKGSLNSNDAILNGEGGEGQNSYIADPYTVYVNPYYIVTHYANYAEVTKHYYNGSQRLAAQLEGDHDYLDEVMPVSGDNPVEEDGKDLMDDLGLEAEIDYSPEELFTVTAEYPDVVMSLEDFNMTADDLFGAIDPSDPILCQISRYWPFHTAGTNCNGAGVIYYYHPDYLGNTEYITDYNGQAYQYFHYSAFGEAMIANKANTGTHTDYFRFNGKEMDPETGNYYYGARYYDPRVSVWLSVDPMAGFAPSKTPYRFSYNNPINFRDVGGAFELPVEMQKKYPILAEYLKNSIQNIKNNPAIMNALIKHGELTREQIVSDLKWGQGPLVVAKDLVGALGVFTPGKNSRKLKLNRSLLNDLENATGDNKDVYLLLTAITLLHEYTHYGDDQDGVQQRYSNGKIVEEGELFVKQAYGKDVHSYNDAVDILNSYNKRHGIDKLHSRMFRTLILPEVEINGSKEKSNSNERGSSNTRHL